MIRQLVIAAVAAALLAGCSPEHGIVRNKRTTVSCISNVCSTHPQLWVSDSSSNSWPYTDRPAAGWVDVDEATYESYRIGDAYPKPR